MVFQSLSLGIGAAFVTTIFFAVLLECPDLSNLCPATLLIQSKCLQKSQHFQGFSIEFSSDFQLGR
jgi:hypothetical protein